MTDNAARTSDNVAMLHSLYDHFLKGEWDQVTAMLDPDFEVIEAESLPYGGRYKGPEGLMQVVMGLGANYDNIKLSDFEVVGSGETVLGLFTFEANAKSTGRPIKMRFCEHWKFRDGKIILLEPFYFDTHAIHKALNP